MSPLLFATFAILASPGFAAALALRENSIQWIDCETNVPQPLQGLELPAMFPSTLHCGRLDVPMDYTRPMDANNKITIGFSMYRPDNPLGLINFNPGGPSSEVSSYAWQIALNLPDAPWFDGLEQFDFLAMDVRGTFSSNPLNCSIGDIVLPSYIPSSQSELTAYQALASTYAQSCIEQSTPNGIVAHVRTAETIQDWDSLRKALSYEKMNFLSLSYGTFGATAYANKFPGHVGNFVLDGVYPHSIRNLDVATFQIRAVNRLLARSDAYCLNDTSCPFHSQGKGAVQKAFSDVLEQTSVAGANPTAADVRAVVTLGYLSLNPNFPALNFALFSALNGNWTLLSYADFGQYYTPLLFRVLPILCSDLHIDDNTFAGFESITNQLPANDPAQIQYSQDLSLLALCGGWPYHGDSNQPKPVHKPMLIVTSDFDLNTPTESTTIQLQQAPMSGLVVRHGDDHGTLFLPGPARSAEMGFLTTGVLPQPRDEEFVTIYGPGSARGPIADPYNVPTGPLAGDFS